MTAAAASVLHRVRRALSPTYGARSNAAEALEELSEADLLLQVTDPGLFAGHPAGTGPARAAVRLASTLWEAFPGHVALLDRHGVVVSVNRAWREFGLANGGCATGGVGRNYLQVCEEAAAVGEAGAAEAAELVRAALDGRDPGRRLDYQAGLSDERWFSLQAVPLPGHRPGALIVHSDVTLAKQRESELHHRAMHDPLTGLPNRALLVDRLQHAVEAAARDPESLAVLYLDLDHFKEINDRLGHAAGDRVLAEAAARLAASVRSGDTIGRWGGDEFLVVPERLTSDETAPWLAERMADSLREPLPTELGPISVGLSVGIAYYRDTTDPDELVRLADESLQSLRRQRRAPMQRQRRRSSARATTRG